MGVWLSVECQRHGRTGHALFSHVSWLSLWPPFVPFVPFCGQCILCRRGWPVVALPFLAETRGASGWPVSAAATTTRPGSPAGMPAPRPDTTSPGLTGHDPQQHRRDWPVVALPFLAETRGASGWSESAATTTTRPRTAGRNASATVGHDIAGTGRARSTTTPPGSPARRATKPGLN